MKHKHHSDLSLSVGFSSSESKDYVLTDLVKEADSMMYENKRKKKSAGNI